MGMSDNLKGSLWMMAAMACFVCNDTLMKSMSTELPLMQAIALRGLGTTVVLLVIVLGGRIRWRMSGADGWRVILRSVAEAGSAMMFIAALFTMQLANATAIMQALPLTVTLAAAVFLGEPVGWKRLAAILVGFLGVMLIVRPGPEGFNLHALLALGAVLTVTARDILTRKLSHTVPSMLVALGAAVTVTVFSLAGTTVDGLPWVMPGGVVLAKVAGCIALVFLGYIASIKTMRVGEIGAVTPFRYSSLVFALILGLLVFGDWPDPLTLTGAVIVVATGLFTLWREQRVAAQARRGRAAGPIEDTTAKPPLPLRPR